MLRSLQFSAVAGSLILAMTAVLTACSAETLTDRRGAGAAKDPATSALELAAGVGACPVAWSLQLETNKLNRPKPYGDSTNAAYASFYFMPGSNLRLKLAAAFPYAEFVSLQVQTSSAPGDVLFDYQIIPKRGSSNPYAEGADLASSPRQFEIEMHAANVGDASTLAENSLTFTGSSTAPQLFTMRVYAPSVGHSFTEADLPKVYAYNATSLAPVACPAFLPIPNTAPFNYLISGIYGQSFGTPNPDPTMKFSWLSSADLPNGNLSTYYLGSNNQVERGRVAVFRLAGLPTYAANTRSATGSIEPGLQTRGWSVCAIDFQTLYTFGCVPDWAVKHDNDGGMTVVVGNTTSVQQAAVAAGANFLWDTRPSVDIKGQPVVSMGFYLRNLLADCEFAQNDMYTGSYCPTGVICAASDYLAGKCLPAEVGDCSLDKPQTIDCSLGD